MESCCPVWPADGFQPGPGSGEGTNQTPLLDLHILLLPDKAFLPWVGGKVFRQTLPTGELRSIAAQARSQRIGQAAFKGLRQKGYCKFDTSLGYIVGLCLKNKINKEKIKTKAN